MMRNLGGLVGIALTSAMLTRREHLHSNCLGEFISLYNPLTRERLDQLASGFHAHGFDPAAAGRMALAALDLHCAEHLARVLDLGVFALPLRSTPLTVSQAWHPRLDADPVRCWLRQCVKATCVPAPQKARK